MKSNALKKSHTPGPWSLGSSGRIFSESAESVVFDLQYYGNGSNDRANARLMSQAPMLLEALKTALEFIDAGGMGDGVNAHAKATIEQYLSRAIAKATGGEE